MTWSDLLGPAFLADGYVGHLSYLLLVISMMMRRMLLLRLFVIASALSASPMICSGSTTRSVWSGKPFC